MPFFGKRTNVLTGKEIPVSQGDLMGVAAPMTVVAPEIKAALEAELVQKYLRKFVNEGTFPDMLTKPLANMARAAGGAKATAPALSPYAAMVKAGKFAGDRTVGSFPATGFPGLPIKESLATGGSLIAKLLGK